MRVTIDLLAAEKEADEIHLAVPTLLEELAQADQTNEYHLITTRSGVYSSLETAANVSTHVVKMRSSKGFLAQYQLLLPKILQQVQPDVLHIPAFIAPIGWQGPLVLTLTDQMFLKIAEQPSLHSRLYWQHLLRESVRRAQRIVVDSEQTRHKLITDWAVQPEYIGVLSHTSCPLNISADADTIHRIYQEALNVQRTISNSCV